MSRDCRLPLPDYYAHMHELQPPYPHYTAHHPHALSSSSPSPGYEMTAASSGSAGASAPPLLAHDPRKRKNSYYSDYELSDAQCSGSERSSHAPSFTRKRRSSSYGTASAYEDDGCDESVSSRATSCSTQPDRKQNHSEIEKRRRDKMNTYISELSGMIPMCGAVARKLDKLSVLRMAVAHLRGVRGALAAGALAQRPRPALLPERDLNALLLHAAAARHAFLIVVGCDRGRLLFVSHGVTRTLHYQQSELVGQSLFDILHPKDVAKVKEQLSSSDLNPRERLIDAKTMLPVRPDVVAGAQRLCPGARRSFFCRIKSKQAPEPAPPSPPVKEERIDPAAPPKHRKKADKKYCVVQCTGYLKSWTQAALDSGADADEEQTLLSCLVAIGRALPEPAPPPAPPAPPARRLQYVSRHAVDGKFLFVDQRVRLALGFLPQELLGTSLYEYVGGGGGAGSVAGVARAHQHALRTRRALTTPPYHVRRKDGSLATLLTHFKPFRNPWTKDVECLVANNTVVSDGAAADADAAAPPAYDAYEQNGAGAGPGGEADAEVQRLIAAQVESHKIGAAIAEEARRRPPPPLASPQHDPIFGVSLVDNVLGMDPFCARNNVPASAAPGGGASPPSAGAASPPPLALDGNGEAAMAVIMSLLEADAGLGGPVNFSGLPWPLP